MREPSIRCRGMAVAVFAIVVAGCASSDVIEADRTTRTTVDDELILESIDGDRKGLEVIDGVDDPTDAGESGDSTDKTSGPAAGSRSPGNVTGPVVDRSSGTSSANGASGAPLIDGGAAATPSQNQGSSSGGTPPTTAHSRHSTTVPQNTPTTAPSSPGPTTPTSVPGVAFEPPMRAGVQQSASNVSSSQRVQTITFWASSNSPSALWRLESCDGFDYRRTGSTWVQATWSTDSSCGAARIVLSLQPTSLTRSIPSGATPGDYRFCTFIEEYGASGLTGRVDVTCAPYTIR